MGPLSLDVGRGDIGRGDIGAADEVDFEIATASGNTPPNELKARVIGLDDRCSGLSPSECHRIWLDWKAPNVGSVVQYFVHRMRTNDPTQTKTPVGSVAAALGVVDYFLVDTEELPNANFTYFVVAEFIDDDGNTLTPPPLSGPSNFFTILAVNTPPVAVDDPDAMGSSYTNDQGTQLVASVPGVLGNDTDVDSPLLTAALVSGPSRGTLTLNANGSFTYTSDPSYFGLDSFRYTANDVDPSNSREATVLITVRDATPPVVTVSTPSPTPNPKGWNNTVLVTVVVSATDPSNVSSVTCTDNEFSVAAGSLSLSGLGTHTATGSLSVSAEGTHSLLCTATDSVVPVPNSGAASGSSNTRTVKIDTVAPTITITTPANNEAYLLNQPVASSSYSCLDPTPGSGLATPTCIGPVSSGSNFYTSPVGPKTFSVTATDIAGNVATKTHNYFVNYSVTLTALKTPAQLGSAVPVVFQVKDGLGIVISSLSPTVQKIESVFNGSVVPSGGCVSSESGLKETLYSLPDGATGKSSLRFISSTQSYQFNWDTTTAATLPIATSKGCYTVLIYLNDRPQIPLTNPRRTTPVQLK